MRILALRRYGFPPTVDYLGDSENVIPFCKEQLEWQIKRGIEYAAFIVYEHERIEIIRIEKIHEELHREEAHDH